MKEQMPEPVEAIISLLSARARKALALEDQLLLDDEVEAVAWELATTSENPDVWKIQAELEKHKSLLKKCHCEREVLAEQVTKFRIERGQASLLDGKSIGMVGGLRQTQELVKKAILSVNSSVRFKQTITEKNKGLPTLKSFEEKYSHCHLLILITEHIGHDGFGNVEDVSRKHNIPLIISSTPGQTKQLISQIFEKLE